MAIFSFFKRPRHQKFDYKPRYYNPEKEDLQARLAKYKDDPDGTHEIKNRISSGFRRKAKGGAGSSSYNKRANLRLVAIMVILVWMTYIFLQKYLPVIVDAVE